MVPPVASALINFKNSNAGYQGTTAQPIPDTNCKITEIMRGIFRPYL